MHLKFSVLHVQKITTEHSPLEIFHGMLLNTVTQSKVIHTPTCIITSATLLATMTQKKKCLQPIC